MIKVENTETYGWKAAIRGMRNPLNSWSKSDSVFCPNFGCVACFNDCEDKEHISWEYPECDFCIGKDDHDLMMRLCNAGTEHRKFLRMVNVTVDITAPLYWWKEFDTYKVGTVRNSCSTMHTIHKRPLHLEDFSYEHLLPESYVLLEDIVKALNECRKWYEDSDDKDYWWQLIQLLPSSYNQRATVQMNYEVLSVMYRQRKGHKLDEWREFCDWVESLPYPELITGGVDGN